MEIQNFFLLVVSVIKNINFFSQISIKRASGETFPQPKLFFAFFLLAHAHVLVSCSTSFVIQNAEIMH